MGGSGLGGSGGFGSASADPLATLKSAIATAEAGAGVDEALIQEAKTLHATQSLQTAMSRRDVAKLRAAIEVAEVNTDVDRAVVEVSGCAAQDSRNITQCTPDVSSRRTCPTAPLSHVCRRRRRCCWCCLRSCFGRRWIAHVKVEGVLSLRSSPQSPRLRERTGWTRR